MKTPNHYCHKLSHKKKLSNSRLLKLKWLSTFHSIPKIFCNNRDRRSEITAIQLLMKKAKPFVIVLPQNVEKAYPFFNSKNLKDLKSEMSRTLSHKFPDKLDINTSKNGIFSGDYHNQETISLNFEDFLTYKGDSHLYLAQIPLYKQLRETDFYNLDSYKAKSHLKANLKQINSNQKTSLNLKVPYPLSTLLRNEDLDSINLWLSRKPTISNWHYDSYDNFLCMISGIKEIRLLSPQIADQILVKRTITDPFYNQADEQIKKKHPKEILCNLKENEILFIPQGWYHHVKTEGEDLMVGLSIWFNSIEDESFFKGREDYYLRFLLLKKCEKEIKKKIQKFMAEKPLKKLDGLNPDEIRTFFNKIAADPNVLQEFLLGLNEFEVEFFTGLLEEIDKKIPASKKSVKMLIGGKYGALNGELSNKIDEFYKKFWGEIEYGYFLDRFLEKKKALKLWVLEDLVKNL